MTVDPAKAVKNIQKYPLLPTVDGSRDLRRWKCSFSSRRHQSLKVSFPAKNSLAESLSLHDSNPMATWSRFVTFSWTCRKISDSAGLKITSSAARLMIESLRFLSMMSPTLSSSLENVSKVNYHWVSS